MTECDDCEMEDGLHESGCPVIASQEFIDTGEVHDLPARARARADKKTT